MYLFDLDIGHSFLQSYNKPLNKVILVLDEAHNLPDLATELAGDSLVFSSVHYAYQEAKKYDYRKVADFCKKFERVIKVLSRLAE